MACNPLKHDKIDLTSMWLPGRQTGSKSNAGEILPRNKSIGTIWMGPVNALGIWEAHKIQMDGARLISNSPGEK